MAVSVAVASRSSCSSRIATRSGGAIDRKSSSAAFSRRETWGEPGAGHADLVEGEVDVRLPAHRPAR